MSQRYRKVTVLHLLATLAAAKSFTFGLLSCILVSEATRKMFVKLPGRSSEILLVPFQSGS